MSEPVIEILLVEDNPGDVALTREALEAAKVSHRLSVAYNGEDAVEFLFRRGRYTQASRPNLILLDLNLPRMSGRDVIGQIQSDSALREIPLVVLTSSPQEQSALEG